MDGPSPHPQQTIEQYSCPHCGNRLEYLKEYAGRDAWCRACHHMLMLPSREHPRGLLDLDSSEHIKRVHRLFAHVARELSTLRQRSNGSPARAAAHDASPPSPREHALLRKLETLQTQTSDLQKRHAAALASVEELRSQIADESSNADAFLEQQSGFERERSRTSEELAGIRAMLDDFLLWASERLGFLLPGAERGPDLPASISHVRQSIEALLKEIVLSESVLTHTESQRRTLAVELSEANHVNQDQADKIDRLMLESRQANTLAEANEVLHAELKSEIERLHARLTETEHDRAKEVERLQFALQEAEFRAKWFANLLSRHGSRQKLSGRSGDPLLLAKATAEVPESAAASSKSMPFPQNGATVVDAAARMERTRQSASPAMVDALMRFLATDRTE